jgi:hypothetical protein
MTGRYGAFRGGTGTLSILQDSIYSPRSPFAALSWKEPGLQQIKNTGNFTKVFQRIPVRIEIDPDQKDIDRLVPAMSAVVYADTSAPGTSTDK